MSGFRNLASRFQDFTQGPRTPQPPPSTGGGLTFQPQLSGTVQVSGDTKAALAAAGATNVLGGTTSFVDQFLNPTLSGEQQGALDAFRKTAIGRGLSGEGLESQLRSVQNQLLAGQRLTAAQGLIGEIRSRVDAFREQTSPFMSVFQKASAALQGKGSVFSQLQARADLTKLFNTPGALKQVEGSLFGGLASLGFENVARGELFRRTGAGLQGAAQGLVGGPGGDLTALLSGAVTQLFDPRLSQGQQLPGGLLGRRQSEGASRQVDTALNRILAGNTLSQALQTRLGTLTTGLDELSVFGLGASIASPQKILGLDLGQFQGLFSSAGLLPQTLPEGTVTADQLERFRTQFVTR